MIRCGKLLLISELTECYRPGKSPNLTMEKSFSKRFLSFNFQEQFKLSFTVTRTNIFSQRIVFILVTSLQSHTASGASAPKFCFAFGGVIII